MLQIASRQLRILYGLAVIGAVLPFGVSGWVAMTLGPNPIPMVPYLGPIVLLLIGIWRIYEVLRHPDTLDSYVYGRAMKTLRVIGLVAMAMGVFFLIARFASVPLVRILVPRRSGTGVEFYAVAVYLALFAGIGPLGVLLFEMSRLFGFERHRQTHRETPTKACASRG